MFRLRTIGVFAALFTVALLLSLVLYKRDTLYVMLVPGPEIGVPAPEFTVVDANERAISLSHFQGKTVLLHFMASWCAECQKELPKVQSLYHNTLSDPNFVMVNVAFREDENQTRSFLRDMGYELPVYGDPTGAVARNYGIGGIPAAVIIDADGIIRNKLVGSGKLENFEVGMAQ